MTIRLGGSLPLAYTSIGVKRPCVFCDNPANSREHAIPKWVGKRLGLAKEELRVALAREAVVRRPHQPVIFGTHRARILCRGCNEHFKHLEDEAADLVTWMARGRALRLGEAEQRILGRWGAKTAYTLLAAAGDEFADAAPAEHRHMLRATGSVSELVSVGYARWEGAVNRVVMTDVVQYASGGEAPSSYLVILTFASLAFQVFGLSKLPGNVRLSLERQAMLEVHPVRRSELRWPGRRIYTDRDLRAFVNELPLLV